MSVKWDASFVCVHCSIRADYNYWKLPWHYVRPTPMLAGHDLTSSYMVPFSYIQNYHHYKATCIDVCGSTVYIVTVSASLLVVYHKVSVKHYSWAAPAHLAVQPLTSIWLLYKLCTTMHTVLYCVLWTDSMSVQKINWPDMWPFDPENGRWPTVIICSALYYKPPVFVSFTCTASRCYWDLWRLPQANEIIESLWCLCQSRHTCSLCSVQGRQTQKRGGNEWIPWWCFHSCISW